MNFVNAFQKIGLTVAAVLFSCATLFYSVNPAQADNPTVINATGKIMMDQNTIVKDGKFYWHILVWDTETGKSKMYIFYLEEKSFNPTSYQLPSTPIY